MQKERHKIKTKPKQFSSDYMSMDDLKAGMFERLKESGKLDDVRLKLRNELIGEVLKASKPIQKPSVNKSEKNMPLLPLQVVNWMIHDHLKSFNLEYALSTFVTEANLINIENLLSIVDVLFFLGYDNESSDYKLVQNYKSKPHSCRSFLLTLVHSINKISHRSKEKPVEKQESIVQKKETDLLHPSNIFSDIISDRQRSNEMENLFATQRQLRLEREKYEQDVQILKQKLINELDNLHEREMQGRLEVEQIKSKLGMENDLLEVEREKIKAKELELKLKTQQLDDEVKKRVKTLIDNRESDEKKVKDIEKWEFKLKEQQNWFERELAKMKEEYRVSNHLQSQLQHMENTYKSLETEYTSILQDNESLQTKLKNMSDYSTIKDELSWKNKRMESYEKEIMFLKSDIQAEKTSSMNAIQRLQEQLQTLSVPKTPPEKDTEKQSSQSNERRENEEKILKQLSDLTQIYSAVHQQLEVQKSDIMELHRLIHSVQNQLTKKDQEPLRTEAVAESRASVTSFTKEVPRLIGSSKGLRFTPAQSFNELTLPLEDKYSENSLKFLEDAKEKIVTLQKESRNLEQKYSEFLEAGPLQMVLPYTLDNSLVGNVFQDPIPLSNTYGMPKDTDPMFSDIGNLVRPFDPVFPPLFSSSFTSNSIPIDLELLAEDVTFQRANHGKEMNTIVSEPIRASELPRDRPSTTEFPQTMSNIVDLDSLGMLDPIPLPSRRIIHDSMVPSGELKEKQVLFDSSRDTNLAPHLPSDSEILKGPKLQVSASLKPSGAKPKIFEKQRIREQALPPISDSGSSQVSKFPKMALRMSSDKISKPVVIEESTPKISLEIERTDKLDAEAAEVSETLSVDNKKPMFTMDQTGDHAPDDAFVALTTDNVLLTKESDSPHVSLLAFKSHDDFLPEPRKTGDLSEFETPSKSGIQITSIPKEIENEKSGESELPSKEALFKDLVSSPKDELDDEQVPVSSEAKDLIGPVPTNEKLDVKDLMPLADQIDQSEKVSNDSIQNQENAELAQIALESTEESNVSELSDLKVSGGSENEGESW